MPHIEARLLVVEDALDLAIVLGAGGLIERLTAESEELVDPWVGVATVILARVGLLTLKPDSARLSFSE